MDSTDPVQEALAYVRSIALPDTTMPTPTREQWEQWSKVAAALRSVPSRIDHNSKAQPMTWTSVADYIHRVFPESRVYTQLYLSQRLPRISKLSNHDTTTTTTVRPDAA